MRKTTGGLIVAAGLALGGTAASGNIVIDFADTLAVSGYTQTQMDAIGGSTFYFAHASVGGNMVSGLNALHAAAPGFYKFTVRSEDGTAPASVLPGSVYEHNRGNPGWLGKVNEFATAVGTGGWGGKVDFALNKFCYIDETANLNTYLASMQALEAAHPGTTLVYMTIPLTTASDGDNALRGQFNTGLRSWAAGNNRVLFDIADIEAHSLAGLLQTYPYNGKTYERMWNDWSSDGGHLNAAGSQQVALGFYALAAEYAAIPEPAAAAAALGGLALGAVLWMRRRSGLRVAAQGTG